MFAQERQEKILLELQKSGAVKVAQLVRLFNVTSETIRRDLETLEDEGALTRVHGGAVADRTKSWLSPFNRREIMYIEEKIEIANSALPYIHDNMSVVMDVSTTTLELAKLMVDKFRELSVLTNSIDIAQVLAADDSFTVFLTGGVLSVRENGLSGHIVHKSVEGFHMDIGFFGTSGISLIEGITDLYIQEVESKKALMSCSREIVVMADHSKFDQVAMLSVCGLDEVNILITDSKLPEKIANRYKKSGIELIQYSRREVPSLS